jgi:hypothetical protein
MKKQLVETKTIELKKREESLRFGEPKCKLGSDTGSEPKDSICLKESKLVRIQFA